MFQPPCGKPSARYRDRIELCEEDKDELDRRLRILKGLTFNGHMARENRVKITVIYYVPCSDEFNEAFNIRGRYRKVTGICWNVDEIYGTILLDRIRISFDDILRIDSAEGIFQKDWATEYSEE